MKMNLRKFLRLAGLSLCLVPLLVFSSTARGESKDSAIKSWTTAELLGAMKWAKAATTDKKAKLDFSAAEIICYKRLQKQIEMGSISKSSALLIAETARKKGVYKRETLTLDRAEELRQRIISGRFLEKLND